MTPAIEEKITFRWRFNTGVMIFVLIFLPLTICLGFWQLQRADEKRALLEEYHAREIAPPIAIAEIDPKEDHLYRRVKLTAELINGKNLLLENRIRYGRPGYEVLTPVDVQGRMLWVNRGWIAGSYDRTELPEVPAVRGEVQLQGYLYSPLKEPFKVGEEVWKDRWPQVLQNFDAQLLASRLGKETFPFTLRLNQESPGALETGWPVVNVMPQKHSGYAFQWFTMAVALVILCVYANSNLGAVMRQKWFKPRS